MLLRIKYLIFSIKWLMLGPDREEVWAQVHWDINSEYWDNYEQFCAAMNRGDDATPTWQDLAAYIRGEV